MHVEAVQQKQNIYSILLPMQTHTHFSQGLREVGTGETVALLLIKNVHGEKARKLLKTYDLLLINSIHQRPPRNSKNRLVFFDIIVHQKLLYIQHH